jgi:RHS repeat-associated protein
LCDDERIYYLNDANFNVTTLLETGGDAVERYLYEAYGRVTIYDGSWVNVRSASSFADVAMYTGRERDAETGLYHYRHRSYAAELGRFVGRDPLTVTATEGPNLYNYVANAPPDFTDPSGEAMCAVSICLCIPSSIPDNEQRPCLDKMNRPVVYPVGRKKSPCFSKTGGSSSEVGLCWWKEPMFPINPDITDCTSALQECFTSVESCNPTLANKLSRLYDLYDYCAKYVRDHCCANIVKIVNSPSSGDSLRCVAAVNLHTSKKKLDRTP